MPEKLMSVISPAGLLLTSGFVGRAAGGGSKFESVEWELKKNISWNSGPVLDLDIESGADRVLGMGAISESFRSETSCGHKLIQNPYGPVSRTSV